jgi:predicted metal-dependent hydrolase
VTSLATASRTETPIKARRPSFDLSDTPLHWIPNDPVATHMMNVLHIMLPPGERWFCDVYREALPLISDDKLREDVKGFIGQEATHARAHEGGREYLAGYGIDTDRAMAQAEWMRANLGGAQPFGRSVPRPLRTTWLLARLSAIAAIEHFTAVLGEWILTQSVELDAIGADPHMLDLMRWHGAEEVEHRSVAFDVYQHLSGSYARRLLSMVFTVVALTLGFIIGGRLLLSADPTTSQRFTFRSFRQSSRAGHLPSYAYALRAVPTYLRRDYHPSSEGSTEAALDYLASSPGVAAGPRGASAVSHSAEGV